MRRSYAVRNIIAVVASGSVVSAAACSLSNFVVLMIAKAAVEGKFYITTQYTGFGITPESLQTRAKSKCVHLTISFERPANRLHLLGDNDLQILRLLAAPGVSLPADEPPLKALL